MVSVTLTDVNKEPAPSTRCLITFSDGTQLEFQNLAEMKQAIESLDVDPHQARLMLLAWWLRRDSNATNPALVEGKTLTLDFGAAQPFKVQ